MTSLQSIEGLLFRIYLTGNNISFLHKCIQANLEDVMSSEYFKASFAISQNDFDKKLAQAKRNTQQALLLFKQQDIQCLTYFDKDYPSSLLQTKDFPPLLFVRGKITGSQNMAIVGSRDCSPLAINKTKAIVDQCAVKGLGVISGLAMGIDALAHKAALDNGIYTAAILPTSLDRIFPPQNLELSDQILKRGGALISEQPPFLEAVANPFVLRNRIIAAFSDFIFPVEMKKDSGTRYAVQYGVRYKKTIIICLPGQSEINEYLVYYEGILATLAHYKKQKNATLKIIKDVSALGELMSKSPEQSSLF